jgi:O-antigen ligase
MGLRPQRFWIVWGLMYFPLLKLLYCKIITVDQIKRMVFFVGSVELFLYIAQYYLSGYLDFLYVNTSQRYDQNRFYFSNLFLNLMLFLCVDEIINKRNLLINTSRILCVLLVLAIVGKMRMTTLAVGLSLLIGYILWRKGGKRKVIVFFVGLASFIAIYNTAIVQDTVNSVLAYLAGDNSTALTMGIRVKGRELYTRALFEHPLFGSGYPSILDAKAIIASGYNQNIYLVDNGAWGFAYIYGAAGLVWLCYLFSHLLMNGFRLMKRRNIYCFFLIPVCWILQIQTELHWYFENGGFL